MARKLKCETDTAAMEYRVKMAFVDTFQPSRGSEFPKGFRSGGCRAVFDLGQWWVHADDRECETHTFSVVDACGCDSVDGFGFEEV
jgi:hypothetical protein